MSTDRIQAALEGATDTREVLLGAGVLGEVGAVFERAFGDRAAVVIADETTFEVAGKRAGQLLADGGRALAEPYVFPATPTLHADYDNVIPLARFLRATDAIPVAVGSGTLNDLVKRASHEVERPYLTVARAASVDGYTSFGASITKDGFKQTLTCPAPRAVVADLDVLAAAPAIMTASGYGDLLGKVPAGADWILADATGTDPIPPHVWALVQGSLREAIARPAQVRAGDLDALAGLVEGLMLSGLAMQVAGSSRPASGAEHYFSHLWELEGLAHGVDGGPPPEHGLKVGSAPSRSPRSTSGSSAATCATSTSTPAGPPGRPGRRWSGGCGRRTPRPGWTRPPSPRAATSTSTPPSSPTGSPCCGSAGPSCATSSGRSCCPPPSCATVSTPRAPRPPPPRSACPSPTCAPVTPGRP